MHLSDQQILPLASSCEFSLKFCSRQWETTQAQAMTGGTLAQVSLLVHVCVGVCACVRVRACVCVCVCVLYIYIYNYRCGI